MCRCAGRYPQRTAEQIGNSLGPELQPQLQYGSWEPNPSPPPGLHMLLTAEPALQPLCAFLKVRLHFTNNHG